MNDNVNLGFYQGVHTLQHIGGDTDTLRRRADVPVRPLRTEDI